MKSSYSIIKNVVLTEKSSRHTANDNKYVFLVDKAANRIEIKRAVEDLYKVKVTKVNTLNRRGKRKRERTVRYGMTAGTKRAVVTLKEGNSIDVV